MNTLEIEFEVTEEDLIAFNKQHHARSLVKWIKRIFVLFYCMSPIFFICWLFLLSISQWPNSSIWPNAIVLIPLSVVMLIVIIYEGINWRRMPLLAVRNALRVGHGRSALGQHHLSISAESICIQTPAVIAEVKWYAIWKIVVTGEYAFIYNTPYSAYIIPKRAFDQPDEFESFVKQAQQSHKQSQDYGLVCEKCGFDLCGVTDPGCPECGWRREESDNMP